MNIKPANNPRNNKPSGFWLRILMEFLNGDEDCVEVIPDKGEYKNLRSLQGSITGAIRRYNLAISTSKIGGHLYLIKKTGRDSNEG